MDVKDAVKTALQYTQDLFSSTGATIQNLGLEEVEYDGDARMWRVTVGFHRKWDTPTGALLDAIRGAPPFGPRTYKVVRIDDQTGVPVSLLNRE